MFLPELEQRQKEEELRGQSQDHMVWGVSRGGRGNLRFKEGHQEREQREMSTQPVREAEEWWVGMGRVRWTRMASEAKVEAWKAIPARSSTKTDPLKTGWMTRDSRSALSRAEQNNGEEIWMEKQPLTGSRGRAHPTPHDSPVHWAGEY